MQITAQVPPHFPLLNLIRVAGTACLDHKVDGPFVLTCSELKISFLKKDLSYEYI